MRRQWSGARFPLLADSTLPARSLLLTPELAVRESCVAYLSYEKR